MKGLICLLFFTFLMPMQMNARVGGGGGDKPEEREVVESESYSGTVSDEDNFEKDDDADSGETGWGGLLFGIGFLFILSLFFLFLIKFPKVFPKLSEDALKILNFVKKDRPKQR